MYYVLFVFLGVIVLGVFWNGLWVLMFLFKFCSSRVKFRDILLGIGIFIWCFEFLVFVIEWFFLFSILFSVKVMLLFGVINLSELFI